MTVAAAALALFVGAALQSATGFGFALVSAPILFALLGPREAVTAGFIVAILLNSLTLATERRRPQVLVRDAVALVAWSLPGIALGVLALREVPEQPLSVLVALAVLAGLALRVRSRRADAAAAAAAVARPGRRRQRGRARHVDLAQRPAARLLPARARAPRRRRCATRSRRSSSPRRCIGLPALLLSGTFTAPRARRRAPARRARRPAPRPPRVRLAEGERYESVVLAALALTALVAVATSLA